MIHQGAFGRKIFVRFYSTYKSTKKILDEITEYEGISTYSFELRKMNFLVNESAKTALLLNNVVKSTKRQFETKKRQRNKNKRDILELETTVSMELMAVDHFFQQPQFADFTLAVIGGNRWHECSVFLRGQNGQLEQIHYNPNFSKFHESNNVATSFIKAWEKQPMFAPTIRQMTISSASVSVTSGNRFSTCSAKEYRHSKTTMSMTRTILTSYHQETETVAVGLKVGLL